MEQISPGVGRNGINQLALNVRVHEFFESLRAWGSMGGRREREEETRVRELMADAGLEVKVMVAFSDPWLPFLRGTDSQWVGKELEPGSSASSELTERHWVQGRVVRKGAWRL